ncbi:MAG TPA: hypothetical protein PK358_01170 [Spirochaetota bacterium]|nr:hypothetical protein [Spirochaetota bacterium]HPJ33411.1 hypothetical protein [Spirochaetota bacterium]
MEPVRRKGGLAVFLILAAIYLVYWVYLYTGAEYTECITESFCLNSRDDRFILALVYTATRGLLVIAAFAAIVATLYFMRKRYFFLLAGVFCIVTGLTGIMTLLGVAPPGELENYIHIIIIGAVAVVLGFVFVFAHFKKPGSVKGV